MSFVCPVCGNKDPTWIGSIHGKPYCRKCIKFRGEHASELKAPSGMVVLDVSYPLTKAQQNISNKLVENYKKHIDSLVNAVCGAGKTELVFSVIAYALANKHRVGFALPRRDVAIELIARFRSAFKENSIVLVMGGETKRLEADIVILTTHQLFRYPNYFDLLILDEIDAFPYKGNEVLNALFHNAVRGSHILMSATPDEQTLSEYRRDGREILELNVRFHNKPLPVPKIEIHSDLTKNLFLKSTLKRFINERKPVFIFTPTIKICEELYRKLSKTFKGGNYVHSQRENREQIIRSFRNNHYDYLVTTAVLERGVTLKNVQVIIYNADSDIYNEYSLVQIAGRVGRKYDAPEGEVIFLGSFKTPDMERAIATIQKRNANL